MQVGQFPNMSGIRSEVGAGIPMGGEVFGLLSDDSGDDRGTDASSVTRCDGILEDLGATSYCAHGERFRLILL